VGSRLAWLFHRAKLSPAKAGLGDAVEVLADAVSTNVICTVLSDAVGTNVICTVLSYAVGTDVVCTVSCDAGVVVVHQASVSEGWNSEGCACKYGESQAENQFGSFHVSCSESF
jgi:hypothetical protein